MCLKVVQFDTKMYLNFSNFRGQTSAGGGQALVQKRGQVSDGGGGLAKFLPDGGTPVPPRKNPGLNLSTITVKFITDGKKTIKRRQYFVINIDKRKLDETDTG